MPRGSSSSELKKKRELRICAATGNSPTGTYDFLAKQYLGKQYLPGKMCPVLAFHCTQTIRKFIQSVLEKKMKLKIFHQIDGSILHFGPYLRVERVKITNIRCQTF